MHYVNDAERVVWEEVIILLPAEAECRDCKLTAEGEILRNDPSVKMANLKRVKSAVCLWNVLSGLVQASTEPSATQTCGLISLRSVDFHSLSTRATGFNCDAFSLHLKWSRVFHDCHGVAKFNNYICSAFATPGCAPRPLSPTTKTLQVGLVAPNNAPCAPMCCDML